jgi:hypothetical protein
VCVDDIGPADYDFDMSKVWKLSLFLLLTAIGLLLLLKFRFSTTVASSSSGRQVAATGFESGLNPVDLTAFYDQEGSFDAPGCWQAVPRGLQTLGNVPFRIGGIIQLWGEGPAGIGRVYRESVAGIRTTGKFQTLYVLHGSSFTSTDGTPIAAVVVRYSDGTAATNLIRYGSDSRDWWQPLAEHNPLPTNSPSQVVWHGDHPSLPDWVKCLRLFGTAIPNPKPDLEVQGIDLFSTKSRVAWVVLAMTTGPSRRLNAIPETEDEAVGSFAEMTLKLTALDKETGQPVPDMRFRIIVQSGRHPRPSGIFTADEKGEAVVNLPPEHIRRLTIPTVSSDYPSKEMSWDLEREKIPTNYVFKVSKTGP